MTQPMDRLKKVRALMLIKHPFFATLMMSMPMIETHDIPTAATDMRSLYINPDFVESISDTVLMFVLAHEIMHTALEHGLRLGSRNKIKWNIAADYAINLMLKDSGFEVWEHALLDQQYADMSADQIYNMLKDPPPSGGGGGAGGMGEPGTEHHSPMLGDLKEPEGGNDPVTEDAIRKDIQQRVAQAATIARMTGNMSGALERFVDQVLNPKVPWYELLRHLMTETVPFDEEWTKRNRRFEDIYLPADHSERMGEYIAIGDTSGSISGDELCKYAAEFSAVAEEVQPERIRLVWADTAVAGEQVFEEGELITPEPKGGGGTDMRVPLKHVEQYEPKVVVLFTDGYTPWPTEVDYPLIVCCTTNASVPIGEVIRI